MKMIRIIKKIVIFLLLYMLMLSIAAYANSPVPPNHVSVKITDIPDNAVFADMLIQISPKCLEYIDFNVANGLRYGITNDSPIAIYNEDGFMSFTFHFKDSANSITLEIPSESAVYAREYYFSTFADTGADDTQYRNILKNYHIIKIALLDGHGNILCISDEVDIKPNRVSYLFSVKYNATDGIIEADIFESPWMIIGVIFLTISVILRVALSITIETVIAIPFKVKPRWKIIFVNAVTQIILIVFITLSDLSYIQALILIELFVYLFEFTAYTLLFKNISKPKLALYTVTANTASLIIGILLNIYRAFENF